MASSKHDKALRPNTQEASVGAAARTSAPEQAEGTQLPRFDGVQLEHDFATKLPELAISWQAVAAPNPQVVALNEPLAKELGIDVAQLKAQTGTEWLIGRALAKGSEPVAQIYAGHQFGAYSPRLGDGRALLLGEIRTEEGRLVDVHLKGSGRTPVSRGADGFAAIGPMLREYLVSEGMHALGIATTRSLAVVKTGATVLRDDFLHDNTLPGAVLTRVASSHVRVGSFQFAKAQGDLGLLERLVEFSIERHYPHLVGTERPASGLFREVVKAQAQLVGQWMLVGFVHGVMNTDNMTISGETIDYGPCAFIDAYDLAAVFSSIDHAGRYAFGSQASVARWNLARFAEALLPLLAREARAEGADEDAVETAGEKAGETSEDSTAAAVEFAQAELAEFDRWFYLTCAEGMAAKLGLESLEDEQVRLLSQDLFALLADGRVDYTIAFRKLTDLAGELADENATATAEHAALDLLAGVGGTNRDQAKAWLDKWSAHAPQSDLMRRVNPITIPRNHLLEEALNEAAYGNMQPFNEMLAAATHPFEDRPEWAKLALPAPPELGRFVSFCGT